MTKASSVLRFVLDGKIVSIDFAGQTSLKPSTTVLKYLRSLEGHKGVKEGCGEGDCGACTVVIAEPCENGYLRYKAVDSCLVFLPAMHGKQLITVENLAVEINGKKELHPVQKAMIDLSGSQCGYCTPGIVMSLFALFKNFVNPSKETIQDNLTGNLCRCTGYQAIIEAAEKACYSGSKDHFSENGKFILSLLEEINSTGESLCLETQSQKYYRPASLNHLFGILAESKDAVIVNGSTDVALRQTKKHEHLKTIVDISGVNELRFVQKSDNSLVFGAGATIECVRENVKDVIPAFYELLNVFGSLQIRNVATIGGNIGSASPIGDTLPMLFALGASVVLKNKSTERNLLLQDFITAYRKTALVPGEIIYKVIIPIPENDVFLKSYKVSRRKNIDISTVSGALRLKTEAGIIKEIALAFGGVAPIPLRATQTEVFLKGKVWNENTMEEATEILYHEFSPISDARAGDEFRRTVTANLQRKFYEESFLIIKNYELRITNGKTLGR